jgi:DNA-binding CsgD family transcriptional regulator
MIDMNKKHISNSQEVLECINPLLRTGYISGMSHSRIFEDGSRAELWSNANALEHTYFDTNYTIQTHAPSLYDQKEKYIFLFDKIHSFDPKSKRNYEKHISEQIELFNSDNTFIIRGNDDICEEFFCFYGPKGNIGSRIFFINNIPLLEGFIKEYKKKAKEIIKLSEENRIVSPWIGACKYNKELTKREKEIARLLTYNLTANEIANNLNISKRTVESYVEKIKDKYMCDKKNELVKLLRKDGRVFNG